MKAVSKQERTLFFIGCLIILAGILFNEKIIALFSDGILAHSTKLAIRFFNIISILIGSLLIKYKSYIKGREIIFFSVSLILSTFLLEGGLRGYFFLRNKIIPRQSNFSDYLGWETQANTRFRKKQKGGREETFSTTVYGFRSFGRVETNKTKIFIVGDSFAYAGNIPDGKTYHDYLKKRNDNLEIFAYGCSGYGSLQEYMIIDKYYDLIKPDIILWQFGSNDIINNSYELESASFRHNNFMTRPYYRKGKIEWLFPKYDGGWLFNLVKSSYLLRILGLRTNIFLAEQGASIEVRLTEAHPHFTEAVETTSEIMALVRKRVGRTPIVAFSVDNPKWAGSIFPDICQKRDIYYICSFPGCPNFPDYQEEGETPEAPVDFGPDFHWSRKGHAAVGKRILDYLVEKNLIKF